MASALDRVMEQADAAAATFQAPAVVQPASTAVAVERPAASLDSLADSSGITVDGYLTTKEAGFRAGDMKTGYFDSFVAELDFNEVAVILQCRGNRGGQTTFIKSYDNGVTTAQGQAWNQAEANLRATHDKVDGPYQTVELPLTVLEEIKAPGIGDLGQPGARIGLTPPITGVKFWTAFYKKARAAGKHQGTVKVKVVSKALTNKNGNEWGVADFELLD